MILAAAVIVGLVASAARFRRRVFGQISALSLRSAWLALVAVALQVPLLRTSASSTGDLRFQQVLFLGSYLLLLIFVWLNRRLGAILIVGMGVVSNLLVILANSGFMPITPETLVRINPGSSIDQWPIGSHYAFSKDVIRAAGGTRLWALSDRVVVPPPFPWPAAFSVGDLIIAVGIVALLVAPQWRLRRRVEHEA